LVFGHGKAKPVSPLESVSGVFHGKADKPCDFLHLPACAKMTFCTLQGREF
jgi:hypothetical protein